MRENIALMEGLIRSTFIDPDKAKACDAIHKCPVVTVSRDYGAGGSRIAELLSEMLTVNCFGYAILDKVVKEAKSNKHLMGRLDERFTRISDNWVLSLFGKGGANKDDYIKRLVKAVTAIGQTGGVIIGRGAHLILADNPKVFRVKMEGSPEACIKRVSERENISKKEAKKRIKKVEKERIQFVKELYKRFPTNRAYYDLSISTDELDPHQAVEIIVYAMLKRGLYIPGA